MKKISLTALILLVFSVLIPVQSFSQSDIKSFNYDIYAVEYCNDESLVFAGRYKNILYFNDTDFVKTSPGQYNGFVVKLNQDGSVGWFIDFGGTADDAVNNIDLDTEGNIYLWASSKSPAFSLGSYRFKGGKEEKVILALVNNDGTVQWVKQMNQEGGNIQPYGIAVNEDGQLYTSFTCFSPEINLGGNVIRSKGKADIIHALFTGDDGQLVWAKNAGGHADDFAQYVAIDEIGNCYLAGKTSGTWGDTVFFGEKYAFMANSANSYIAKYSNDGEPQWVKLVNGNRGGGFIDGISLKNNGIYVAGFFPAGSHKVLDTSFYAYDANNQFVASINRQGNMEWVRYFNLNPVGRIKGITSNNKACHVYGYFGETGIFGKDTILNKKLTGEATFLATYDVSGKLVKHEAYRKKPGELTAVNALTRGKGDDIYALQLGATLAFDDVRGEDFYCLKAMYSKEAITWSEAPDVQKGEEDRYLAEQKEKPREELAEKLVKEAVQPVKIAEEQVIEKQVSIEPAKDEKKPELKPEKEVIIQKPEPVKIAKEKPQEIVEPQVKEEKKEVEKMAVEEKPALPAVSEITPGSVDTNPTTGKFILYVPKGTEAVYVLDKNGRFVYHSFKRYAVDSKVNVSIEGQLPGIYTVKIKIKGGKELLVQLEKL